MYQSILPDPTTQKRLLVFCNQLGHYLDQCTFSLFIHHHTILMFPSCRSFSFNQFLVEDILRHSHLEHILPHLPQTSTQGYHLNTLSPKHDPFAVFRHVTQRIKRYFSSKAIPIQFSYQPHLKFSEYIFVPIHDARHHWIDPHHATTLLQFEQHPTPDPTWHTLVPERFSEAIVFYAQDTYQDDMLFSTLSNMIFPQYLAYLLTEFYKTCDTPQDFFSPHKFSAFLRSKLHDFKKNSTFKY